MNRSVVVMIEFGTICPKNANVKINYCKILEHIVIFLVIQKNDHEKIQLLNMESINHLERLCDKKKELMNKNQKLIVYVTVK